MDEPNNGSPSTGTPELKPLRVAAVSSEAVGSGDDAVYPSFRSRKNILLIVLAIFLYLAAGAHLLSISVATFVLAMSYAVACMVVTHSIYRNEKTSFSKEEHAFRRHRPLRSCGTEVVSFKHAFFHEENILTELCQSVFHNLVGRGIVHDAAAVSCRDCDRQLREPDARPFMVARCTTNRRGCVVSVAVHTHMIGRMQVFDWWLFLHGSVDWNRLFALLAFSPIALPFWIIPYFRSEFDFLNHLRRVHSAFYNDLDLHTGLRCLQASVYGQLVETLERHGIDTSDLRVQSGQILNINIRGGRVRLGAIQQTLGQRVGRTRKAE